VLIYLGTRLAISSSKSSTAYTTSESSTTCTTGYARLSYTGSPISDISAYTPKISTNSFGP
jgi:hypothetical protein